MSRFELRLPDFQRMNSLQDIWKLNDYMYQLNEALKVAFSDISEENLSKNVNKEIGKISELETKLKNQVIRKGEKGEPGTAAGFGVPTASATGLEAGQSPTVTIQASGANTEKIFNFVFGIPKGDTGEISDSGWVEFGTSTYGENLVAYSSYQKPRYRKIGGIVCISGAFKTTALISATSGYHALTLPTDIRFNNASGISARNQGSGMNTFMLQGEQAGSVQYLNIGSYGTTSSIDIPVGARLRLDIVYMTNS